MYGPSVVDTYEHYYVISSRDSLTSPEAFTGLCQELDLEFESDRPEVVRPAASALCLRVQESLFDPEILKQLCWTELDRCGVHVHLESEVTARDLESHDFVVIATYARLNSVLEGTWTPRKYQFEVCEKPVVRLPRQFAGKSVVVLDGAFMCIDPLPGSDLFVLGNVTHAIHHTNEGTSPEVPAILESVLDSGIVTAPPITKFHEYIESAREFFYGIEEAEFVGSMFTVRTVLPNKHETDERPTLVDRIDDRTVAIFSGKISTCVEAARQTLAIVRQEASSVPGAS